jgi:hypothetical protein
MALKALSIEPHRALTVAIEIVVIVSLQGIKVCGKYRQSVRVNGTILFEKVAGANSRNLA